MTDYDYKNSVKIQGQVNNIMASETSGVTMLFIDHGTITAVEVRNLAETIKVGDLVQVKGHLYFNNVIADQIKVIASAPRSRPGRSVIRVTGKLDDNPHINADGSAKITVNTTGGSITFDLKCIRAGANLGDLHKGDTVGIEAELGDDQVQIKRVTSLIKLEVHDYWVNRVVFI